MIMVLLMRKGDRLSSPSLLFRVTLDEEFWGKRWVLLAASLKLSCLFFLMFGWGGVAKA